MRLFFSKESFAPSIHMLRPLNTIVRYSLMTLYDCVFPCLLMNNAFFFYFVNVWPIKYAFFVSSYFICMSWYLFKFILAISLDLCHDFWSYTFAMVTISFLFPLLPPTSSSSVFRLTRLNKSSHDARCRHLHCFVGLDLSHQCSFRWICCLQSGLLFHFSSFILCL